MANIIITRYGPFAYVDAGLLTQLTPVLERKIHRVVPDPRRGYRHARQVIMHHIVNDDGELCFSAGLIGRVREHLTQLGYDVVVEDRTYYGHLRYAQRVNVDDAGLVPDADDRAFLKLLQAQPSGQVLARDLDEQAWQLARFGWLFATFDIFVVACNRERVEKLTALLSRYSQRPVTSDTREVWRLRPRMFVGPAYLYQHFTSDGFSIAVFSDLESALASPNRRLSHHWREKSTYGFFVGADRLTPDKQFRLEELIGPVIYPVDANMREAVSAAKSPTVQAVFLRMNDAANSESGKLRWLERKRKMIWKNAVRNSWIVDVATALVSRRNRNPESAGLREPLPARDASVAILVESTEHARELAGHLPGWTIRNAHTPTSCVPGLTHREIGTFRCAEQCGIYADVLIRADGTAGWPLQGNYPVPIAGSRGRYDLIDIDDRMDQQAVHDTQSRRAAYSAAGWQVHNSDMQ